MQRPTPTSTLSAIAAALALTTALVMQAAAEPPSARELLKRMDANLTFETRKARVKMTVEGKGRTRVYEMVSFGRGQDDAAVEYLEPRRDKGTKMLKLGDELWIYLPAIERVQKISGHMLRQGMMGSDVSYEDMMASRELEKDYRASVTGSGSHEGRDCWLLELKATKKSVSYQRRKTWVDKETLIPVKQELYALSGKLLKTWTMSRVKLFGERRFPTHMVIRDHTKKGSSTTIEMTELVFGIRLEDEVFARRWLERRH
ncbi:MAG: outer membrane lipoprotein-sorting protein [Myxococcales bacterium]|nr:outer membrane lipoprotein-sorting protein [Myxococcales bacterium]